jgi:formylglycine-generating enzyme required for sulfatase activity
MTATLITRQIEHPLAAGGGPEWAAEWGEDRQFGPFAVLELPDNSGDPPVRQLFRWAPSGSFRRGSPDDEPGRSLSEGPVHWVTITRGFWIADSPCTQAFWQAVMGNNPSRFIGQARPVESVSWQDVQGFLERLNQQIPSLNATLPTEAQWEYACRAGSQSATYPPANVGGHRHQKASHQEQNRLDEIAWYESNSSYSSHPVRQKLPNAWGLYDMLGHVWEWCLDGQRDYNATMAIDPRGPDLGSRCVRGGSWYCRARLVRCACRLASEGRSENLGFRLVRVQDRS